ncbi:MAG: efflux RND transporter periplasmic adaptor subunit [Pseudomonadales bacterium]|nr:efflux RND transporter periplasmic adaptor subunit [Pseudomonadales bacterium]
MNFMKWAVTVFICALVFAALATYKMMDIRASIAAAEAYPEQSETVEEAFVTTSMYRPAIMVMGEIVAPRRLDLRNEIAGEITAVNFSSGAQVEQGQLLVQLDIALEEANLQAARARTELARLMFKRHQDLYASGVSNQEQLDRARADLASSQAEVAVLEHTIVKKTLRAPFSGRAGLHTFEVGQYLPSNSLITELVADTDRLWVDFQIPQFYPPLATGSEVVLTAINNEHHGKPVTATLMAENTVINAGNRSRGYRASIPNAFPQFVPQAIVKVQAPTGEPRQVLQVPALAVQNDTLGQYVFVLREDAAGKGFRAIRQQVQVRIVENDVALLEPGTGLVEGERIAAAGAFKLYEGILVHIGEGISAQPSPMSATAAGSAHADPAMAGEVR